MNYQQVYNQLIQKRKTFPATKEEYGYVESHHIIPRSEGGSNAESNLVKLTAREHYIAHLLLTKIYNDMPMYCAYVMMTKHSKQQDRAYKINSRLYDVLKRIRNKMLSGKNAFWYGRHLSEETKKKISKRLKGKPSWLKGKHLSEETRQKLSKAKKGKRFSDEHKLKLSQSCTKHIVLQYSLDGKFIKEWKSVRDVILAYNCTDAAIRMCCIGKNKSSCGYVWKYKEN